MTNQGKASRFDRAMSAVSRMSFPDARQQLEVVARELDKQKATLDRSVQLRCYAQALAERCHHLLSTSDEPPRIVALDSKGNPGGTAKFEPDSSR